MEEDSMRRIAGITVVILFCVTADSLCVAQAKKGGARAPVSTTLVTVDGQNITESDLQRIMQTRQVPPESREKYRRPFLEEMIDARLIRQFLASRKISAKKEEVEQQVQQIQELAAQRGSDPEKLLVEMGYTAESIREEFALPLAWKRYVDGRFTDTQVKKYFEAHRAELDGTRVRARQIMLRVPSKEEADFTRAEKELADLRQQILNGEISFEEAAKTRSQGPSKENGGDVGYFPFSGKMPSGFSREAFQLETGEISAPFRSTFGVHLCQVTDRKPGELSLEDVRDEVVGKMSQELWKKTATDLRNSAKIEWKMKP